MPQLYVYLTDGTTEGPFQHEGDGYDMELFKESGVLVITKNKKWVTVLNAGEWRRVDIQHGE